MTGKEEKVKNIIIYIIPNIASVFLPIITLPIFTRILTKNDYGIYALAEIYAILLSGIANFGLTLSYERNFFQYQDKRKASELFYSTLIFVLVAFLIATVFTYVFKKPMSKIFIGSEDYGFLLLWVFLARGVASFKQYFLIYFKNSTKAKDFTIYTINETFLAAALSCFLLHI
ncbi:MAG: oligosaccharide flippase family protein [Candidatus Zapsychrus exili]|nr:oligosaccharide flippase family protein [Candidatus Zapsychrus exili]